MVSKKGSMLTKKITSDWKNFFHQDVSMEPKVLPYIPYLSSNPHGRKCFFFQDKDVPLLGKIKISSKIVFFIKRGFKKGSLLTKKTFFIRQYLWNVKFAIHTLVLPLPLTAGSIFFKPKKCLLWENWKFHQNHVFS